MKKWITILLVVFVGHAASAQDLIVKRNAEEINAKILSVSSNEVEYRKFDNLEGPIYKLPIGEVFYIKYQNGTKDVFAEQTPTFRPRLAHSMDQYPHYQGEIAAAYGLGLGLASKIINTNRFQLETVHGARICPYFFIGAGLAFNYFYNVGDGIRDFLSNTSYNLDGEVDGAGYIPFFMNTKGYYPINGKCSLYLSLDLGASIPACGLAKGDPTQFYTAVGPGINFGNGRSHSRGDFSIRYQYMGTGLNAILFRIGLGF